MSVEHRKKAEEMLPDVGFAVIFLLVLLCGSYNGWNLLTMLKAIALGSVSNLCYRGRIYCMERKIAELEDEKETRYEL